MQGKILSWILAWVLVALGIVGVSGCGRNEARASRAPVEAPEETDPAGVLPVEDAAPAQEPDVWREVALADRELEIAEAERELAERTLELETRERELEARETEPAVRERREPEDTFVADPVRDSDELDLDLEPVTAGPGPEPVARMIAMTLPVGTPVRVEMTDPLSSETSFPGDGIRATVARDVVLDGRVVVPAGSKVLGTVAAVERSKKIGGQARLSLSFERMDLPSGEIVSIASFVELTGERQKKKDAATIGGSAAGGAILGRVLSKKKSKGTAIGAILGAAVGAAVASENRGDPVVVEPGTIAELFLESPVEVAVPLADAVAFNR